MIDRLKLWCYNFLEICNYEGMDFMAKTTNCAFCGKELTKGFFKGDSKSIFVSTYTLDCCKDCLEAYDVFAQQESKRFSVKLDNYKKATKSKPDKNTVAQLLKKYYDEYFAQIKKGGLKTGEGRYGCFVYAEDGSFSVRETPIYSVSSDITAKDMIKSLKKAEKTQSLFFTKDDVTKIEYAQNGMADMLTMTAKAFSYSIRLNDETEITYKPCVTRTAAVGKGFAFGYKKSAEKALMKELNEFKKITGCDLPVVKVKKI